MSTYAVTAARVVTCSESAGQGALGVLEDGAFIVDDKAISWVGKRSALPKGIAVHDEGANVVTPGLVDAHTHAAWVGSRHDEYVVRMAGGDYEAIARAGGGIVSSHRQIVAAEESTIREALIARAKRMASLGVTTIEVKSGYGLLPEEELKQLRAIRDAKSDASIPRIVSTFLGLHAIPPSLRDRRDEFLKGATGLLERVQIEGLADFVDAYIDRNAFSVEESRAFLTAAKAHGFELRLHVGQFSDIGGAELASELGAKSVDHLEVVGEAAMNALANAGVFASLLPTACFTLKQEPPPVARLRAHGIRFVIASDANPGTSPSESLPLAMAMGVRLFGLTPEETILGVTRHAAASLAKDDVTGSLAVGKCADYVVWDLPHEHALLQPWGVARTKRVVREGRVIGGSDLAHALK